MQSNIEQYFHGEGIESWKDMMEVAQPGYLKDSKITQFKEFYIRQEFASEMVEFSYDNWKPRKGDVLIVSFPKTGTTWMREIMKYMLYKDDENMMKAAHDYFALLAYLEGGKPSKYKLYEQLPFKRIYYSTHLPPDLINMKTIEEKQVKIIFTLRNPKDELLSYFKFVNSFPFPTYRIDGKLIDDTWDGFFDEVVKEKQHPFGLPQGEWYFDYIKRWMPYFGNDNFLVVHYEDLVKSPANELKRISSHIEVDLSENELARVKEGTDISTMTRIDDKPGLNKVMNQGVGLVGKGGIGKWKSQFTKEQSEFIDELYHEQLSNTNIKFIYE